MLEGRGTVCAEQEGVAGVIGSFFTVVEVAKITIDSQKKIREAEGRVEWTGQ
jgi:hypothetical protein